MRDLPNIEIILYDSNGASYSEKDIYSLTFINDYFSPATTLRTQILAASKSYGNFSRCELYIDGKRLHNGIIVSADIINKGGYILLNIFSRGFTVLLTQNYLKPALYSDVSQEDLVKNYVKIENISCEKCSEKSYIYIDDDISIWDAVERLNFRLKRILPYISDCNKINFSSHEYTNIIKLGDRIVLECGKKINTNDLFSEIYMNNVDGDYDSYGLKTNNSSEYNIVRRKEIPLDRGFLYDPNDALAYRAYKSTLKTVLRYIKISGYIDCSLNDRIQYGNYDGNIKRIEIRCIKSGIFTKYYI